MTALALAAQNYDERNPPGAGHPWDRWDGGTGGTPVTAITGDDFLAMALPERKLILSPWLVAPSLSMVHAYRGVGKTHLCLAIGVAIATGGSIGPWRCSDPRRVIYVDGEMPARLLQERLAEHASGRNLSRFELVADDLHPEGLPDLSSAPVQEMIRSKAKSGDLLVLDNISCLFRTGDENEAKGWVSNADWLRSLRRDGISVILVHHSGKTGAQRGTSKREDILDCVIGLKHPQDYDPSEGARFEVHFEKARGCFGPEVEPFELQYSVHNGEGTWKVADVAKDDTDEVQQLIRDGLSLREIEKQTGIPKSTVSRIKRKMGRHDA